MPRPETYDFSRYLAAKKSVDDRALSRYVWNTLASQLRGPQQPGSPRILEIGAGIGTMIERLVEWELLAGDASLTAIDADTHAIAAASDRLARFAADRGLANGPATGSRLDWHVSGHRLSVALQVADLESFAATQAQEAPYDLLIAHAVLDLLDVRRVLPILRSLAADEGLMYLTLNFDGATILEPQIDPELDRLVEELYHQTMDQRLVGGEPSGDRYTGRHLFRHLKANGLHIVAAGSSDWVVFPNADGYPGDETYFLHFIIHTISAALEHHPQLDRQRFGQWVEERHRQIERGELVYIAHQIDILAQR